MKTINILMRGGLSLFVLVCLLLFVTALDTTAQGPRSVSMDFQQAALKDVLKVFSQQAGLNFVATENIEDKNITLYLDNVTVSDALNSIMSANNLTYEQAQGSAVFIVKESGKPKIEMATKVYTLDFARIGETGQTPTSESTDMKSVIENLLSKDIEGEIMGKVVIDKRTNSLIITTIPADFPVIEDTIRQLDSITPQALIEAEIVEIHTGALKSLGLEWGSSDGTFIRFTGPKRLTHFPFVRSHNPLSRGLLSSDGAAATEATNELGVLSLQEFSLVVKALETEGMARYLAKPRIMSLSNESAEIKITSDTAIGIIVSDVTDTGRVIEEAERVETGVTLKVTPTVNRKGYITMTIEPEVSRAVQSLYFPNFIDPAKRSAKTTVMVKDGQTIAIGGLLKTDEEDQGRDVPGLSRIPLFGNLFRTKEKRNVQTEIIVFITAHAILDTEDMIQTAKALQDHGKESLHSGGQASTDTRDEEIQKTVMRLRRKRELERNR
jgi:type II secretory pathway component GspD/PulD (secretin)